MFILPRYPRASLPTGPHQEFWRSQQGSGHTLDVSCSKLLWGKEFSGPFRWRASDYGPHPASKRSSGSHSHGRACNISWGCLTCPCPTLLSGAWLVTGFALCDMWFALLTEGSGEDSSQKPGRKEYRTDFKSIGPQRNGCFLICKLPQLEFCRRGCLA